MATAGETTLLEQALAVIPQTDPEYSNVLLKNLVDQALAGVVTFESSATKALEAAMDQIDGEISRQLAAILHEPAFQELEAAWRGLFHLLSNSEVSSRLVIRALDISKDELNKDLSTAIEFDQSKLFKKVYEEEYGSPGGSPYGLLVGDYYFRNHPEDIGLLEKISGLAAAAFAPFISSAGPSMFGMEDWSELSNPRDLAKIFESVEYAQWRAFRESEDSRYVTLCLPRVLARLPYGDNTKPVEDFHFEEVELTDDNKTALPVAHDAYTWMNAAWVLAQRHTEAFAQTGFSTLIRGAQGGGKVEGLPAHTFLTDDGDIDLKCPTEIAITDRREAEISNLGFMPLSHYKNTNYAVFFGGQTTQRPAILSTPDATANAAISARLPCIMASSRFAHYLKVIARDLIGSFMELDDVTGSLNEWIGAYVSADPSPDALTKASYPLAAASISVEEIPGRSGSFQAVAWVRPWLQLEELSTSIRLVAAIP